MKKLLIILIIYGFVALGIFYFMQGKARDKVMYSVSEDEIMQIYEYGYLQGVVNQRNVGFDDKIWKRDSTNARKTIGIDK